MGISTEIETPITFNDHDPKLLLTGDNQTPRGARLFDCLVNTHTTLQIHTQNIANSLIQCLKWTWITKLG